MAVAFLMLLVAGTPWQQLSGLAALVCVSIAVVLVAAPAIGVHVLKPYQTERLTAFLHPSSNFEEIKEKESKTGEPDPRYQLAQSKIAIGSGEKTGRGSDSTQIKGEYVRRTTPTSCSRPSASSTASSVRDSCYVYTGC